MPKILGSLFGSSMMCDGLDAMVVTWGPSVVKEITYDTVNGRGLSVAVMHDLGTNFGRCYNICYTV